MTIEHPLLGRAPVPTPVRTGGVTGRVGSFGLTRVGADGSPKMHKGVDLLAVDGWPVFAAHRGIVDRAGWENPEDHAVGYGRRVRVVGGAVSTVYAHLDRIDVEAGDEVEAGDRIGVVGRSGNVAAGVPTHLHFELHVDGAVVDPVLSLTT